MGGPPGQMPPIEGLKLGQKGKGKKSELPKLVDDCNKKNSKGLNIIYGFINRGYQLYFIVSNFCKRIMWWGSCVSLMYMFPMAIEYMSEQNRILQKIQMEMAASGDLMSPGADQGQPAMRPF